MSRTLMRSTQVRIMLSVNLECKTPTGGELVSLPLLSLTWLVMLVWQVRLVINRLKFEIVMSRRDLIKTAAFVGRVVVIGLNSLAIGLGVRL